MFCPKCGSEIAEGAAFCGKCGAPVGAQAAGAAQAGSAQGAAGAAVGGAPAPKRNGAKIGAIVAAAVVVVVLVVGFATNWFGLVGVQPKEAVEVPVSSQSEDGAQDANAADGQSADTNGSAGDAQGDSQAAASAAVKSAVEAYTWDELSQISAEISAAGDEAAAIEVAKRYNLCTPEGKLDGTQVKSVTLADGTQTTVQIVGFAHDDKTAGGKAGITFMFSDCIGTGPMNADNTDVGGWEASELRAYLNDDGMASLPDDLREAIVPVEKITSNVDALEETSPATVTSDSLWLFSTTELCGAIDWYADSDDAICDDILNSEGAEYKLFRDVAIDPHGENGVLIRNYQGSPQHWWERTPFPAPILHDHFQAVESDGNLSYIGVAGYSYGVVPGFCI